MHRNQQRLEAGVLLVGTVCFGMLGQYYLSQRRDYVWDGIIFIGISLLCFSWLVTVVRRSVDSRAQLSARNWRDWGRRVFVNRRAAMMALAVFLNWIAARSANAQPSPQDFSWSVVLWLASLALCFLAFAPISSVVPGVKAGLHNAQRALRRGDRYGAELALVLGLVMVGLVLRGWDLEHIPANLSGDEGTQGLWALDVLEGRLLNPFSTGWFTVPTMSFFAQAASLRLFGSSIAGLRALSAVLGTLTLILTYLFARRNISRRVAVFSLGALTFNHYHIHFSRLGSNQIADPFFMTLTLLLLTEGLRRKRNAQLWFLGAGLTMGLSWFGYFGSRVIVLVVAAFFGIQALTTRGFLRRYASALVLMLLIAFMSVSPLLLHYADYPQDLGARFNQVNFLRWLDNELARPEHDSTFNLVVRQIWRSISAFNHTLDPTFWYRAQIPLLDVLSGALLLLGLVVAVGQRRRSAVQLILLWAGFAITLGWILTENPPSSMRMVVIAPAIALLVGISLDRLLILAHWAFGLRRVDWNRVGLAVLTAIAVLNVYYYFIVYTPTRIYGNPSAETATVLARYLADRVQATTRSGDDAAAEPFVYFYGPPFLYYDFGAIRFIARGLPGVNVPREQEDPDFRTPVSGPTFFIVLRERLDELDEIQKQHPNGDLHEFHSEADGRLMFVSYEVFP
jgi:4-amino-4-deoxy-L-arabinose transferase-like glycosyltransferase